MQPVIKNIQEKKLVGTFLSMTFSNNQTFQLWHSFMPRRNEIKNNLTNELISMQIYPPSFDFTFQQLNIPFQKWAAIEVSSFESVPSLMESFILTSGLYAVFFYKGLNTDYKIFEYIYGTWLPASIYSIDNRPHFEILGAKYKTMILLQKKKYGFR